MTSSSTFRSRSCKIKEPTLKENSLQSKPENDLESIETKSPCEPSTTRISWKTSKIFSRTLSSIEVIRAMKSNKQNHQHHSQSNQHIPVSPTKPSVIVTATGDSAISTSIVPASKTSRHEVTSHSVIIKDHPDGAILSENNETASSVVRTRSGNSKAASEWKVLKNKLSSLRKRSTSSSSGPRGDGEESLSASTSPSPGDGESEGRRLSANSRTGSARTSRSGSQDEGIVCKREDLISLLTEATKVASNSTSVTANSPPPPLLSTATTTTSIIKPSIMKSDQQNSDTSPTSIGPRKVILKTSSAYNSVVQVTGADNIDTTRKLMKKSALKKNTTADSNNNYNSNSNNNASQNNNCNNSRPNSSTGGSVDSQGSVGFIETRIVVPSKPSLKFDLPHEKENRNRQTKAIQFKETESSPVAMTTAPATASSSSSILTPSPSSSTTATTITTTCDSQNTTVSDNELTGKGDKKILIEADNQDSESSPSVAAVKWDESNVVDAMILGDAIQAFLRGMGGSTDKPDKPTEKRVLFKKLS